MHKPEIMRIKIKPQNRKDRRAARGLEKVLNAIHARHEKDFDRIAFDAVVFGLSEEQVAERVRGILDESLKFTDK